jgi:phage recombination protein Bet
MTTTPNLPTLTDEYCMKEFGWTKSRFEVIQRTYFKGLTIDDIAIFGHVCKHVGLDPFLKQIYPVIRETKQKDGSKKPTMSIQTGIDGYRAIAERTEKYSPGKEPLFKYDKDGRLFSATSYVMKMTKDGKWHEVAATAIMSEYRPSFQNDFWATKPHIMLSKCAEALALRKAFPAELSVQNKKWI